MKSHRVGNPSFTKQSSFGKAEVDATLKRYASRLAPIGDPESTTSRLLSNLYIGDETNAKDEAYLNKHGITHIISLCDSKKEVKERNKKTKAQTIKSLFFHDGDGFYDCGKFNKAIPQV